MQVHVISIDPQMQSLRLGEMGGVPRVRQLGRGLQVLSDLEASSLSSPPTLGGLAVSGRGVNRGQS